MPAPTPSVVAPASGVGTAGAVTVRDGLGKAIGFLEKARSPDGGWHSKKYRDMAEGPELSPFVLKALAYAGASAEARAPSERYLAAQKPSSELIYPVYTSSGMLLNGVQGPWRSHLLGFQATEELGWKRSDLEYGGWSYALAPPRRGEAEVPTLSRSNVPSTLFALGGLSLSGGVPEGVADKALLFLSRCQNYPKGDGGFCASASDPAMNKAGGHVSYGSATSDGVRALLRCGLKATDPRVVAARAWMSAHLSAKVHPGDFPEGRLYDRDSLYFYYLWSTAHALAALQRAGATLSSDEQAWQSAAAARLLELQRDDGSWSNPAAATREDDTLVATPMAMSVLVLSQGAAR